MLRAPRIHLKHIAARNAQIADHRKGGQPSGGVGDNYFTLMWKSLPPVTSLVRLTVKS
jgi:hypothetical protein